MKTVTHKFGRNIIFFFSGILLGMCIVYISNNAFGKSDKMLPESEHQIDDNGAAYIGNNEPIRSDSELETNILKRGDIESYIELRTSYIDKEMFTFLPWALVMSNKYNYKEAYFDVYNSLYDLNSIDLSAQQMDERSLQGLDIPTQKFVVSYLKKASENGHGQATEILEMYRQNNVYQFD